MITALAPTSGDIIVDGWISIGSGREIKAFSVGAPGNNLDEDLNR
jgi:hypothetical protein